MKLSEHIRQCQDVLAERGDIDAFAWSPHFDRHIDSKRLNHMLDEPAVSVRRHPEGRPGQGAFVAVIEA